MGFASKHHMIDTLGTSKKGQFVAVEEYGYNKARHSYYVNIRIINVWKSEDVIQPITVEEPALKPGGLQRAREKARNLSQEFLSKYIISA